MIKGSSVFVKIGISIIIVGVVLLIIFLFPVIQKEIVYFQTKDKPVPTVVLENGIDYSNTLIPVDNDFSIVIPKIFVNSKVIKNVDPNLSSEYQYKLTTGVAHAKGTSLPNQEGNVFLFAHSSENIFNANRYNSVFYLLNKLEIDDDIFIIYNNKKYEYKAYDRKIVDKDDIKYLGKISEKNPTLTLMTCWPFGTTLKRLVILANLVKN